EAEGKGRGKPGRLPLALAARRARAPDRRAFPAAVLRARRRCREGEAAARLRRHRQRRAGDGCVRFRLVELEERGQEGADFLTCACCRGEVVADVRVVLDAAVLVGEWLAGGSIDQLACRIFTNRAATHGLRTL